MAKTLTDLLTLVGLRYERNSANSDADTASRTSALNEASREMAMELADQCWYLQRIASVSWTAQVGFAQTLDASIQRILYIEDPITPGKVVPWRGDGISSNGELLVILDRVASATLSVHYLVSPTELVSGSDTTEVPDLYVDALVLGACKILAETSGSSSLYANFVTQYQDRMRFVSRDCYRRHRQRNEDSRVELDTFNWHDGMAETGPYYSYWW